MRLNFFKILPVLVGSVLGLLSADSTALARDAVEVSIDWHPGDMIANPTANLVYVVNETDGDLVAVSTHFGSVAAHKRFDYDLEGAQLFLAPDASVLYFSVPSIRKLYTLSTLDLTQTAAVDLDVKIGSFVIASDGRLYASDELNYSGSHQLVTLDPASGAELFRLNYPPILPGSLFRLSSSGSDFYVSKSTGSPLRKFATSAGSPVFASGLFTQSNTGLDLSVDDANDRLYTTPRFSGGVQAWNIAAETQEFWSFGGPAYSAGVTQLPGSTTVWGASGSTQDGVLMEFNKATGTSVRQINLGRHNSTTNEGSVPGGSLEITSNGRLLYAKDHWTGNFSQGVKGYLYYLGITDITSATVTYTPSTQIPFAPNGVTASDEDYSDRVQIEWEESGRGSSYQISRSTTNNSSTSTQIGTVTAPATEYHDTSAANNQVYFYWVRATNISGSSPPSFGDAGSVLDPPGAPINFRVSAGSYADRVRLSHDYQPDTSGSRFYRSQTDDFSSAVEIQSTPRNNIFDQTAVPGGLYYYWARLENGAGLGPVSQSQPGYAGSLDISISDHFQQFVSSHDLSGDDSALGADPDGDGIDNYSEWLQGGSDPADSSSLPTVVAQIQKISDLEYLTINYLRLVGGVQNEDTYQHVFGNYRASGNHDLEGSQWDVACVSTSPPAILDPAPEGYEWGSFRLSTKLSDSPHGFLRLSVMPPAP